MSQYRPPKKCHECGANTNVPYAKDVGNVYLCSRTCYELHRDKKKGLYPVGYSRSDFTFGIAGD